MKRAKELEELFEDLSAVRHRMMPSRATSLKSSITPAQWAVLKIILHQTDVTVKKLAQQLGTSSSAATQLIETLVKSGYVLRKESALDRRSVLLELTPKSKKTIALFKKEIISKLETLFKILDDKEFAEYVALNKKIANRSQT